MNAIIGVGQFCEIHGPCLVFCTQTVLENVNNKDEIDTFEVEESTQHLDSTTGQQLDQNCEGCSSIGIDQALITKPPNYELSKVSYISTQLPRKIPLRQYLKQACVRSLSCEIGGNSKSDDSCTMCFCDGGDRSGGHTVLCYTWRVPDAQARGFHRWLTIVLLMKDRFMLMAIWSFFIKHVEQLVQHLQNKAKSVYKIEEENGNNRAARLQSGRAPTYTPRSLAHLTGLNTVWSLLHTRFTWILHSAPRSLTDIPPYQNISNIDLNGGDDELSFRDLYQKMEPNMFTSLCHCATTGIQIVLRGDDTEGMKYLRLISQLIPSGRQCKFQSHCTKYLQPFECSLLAVNLSVALPKPNANIFRIDMMPNKWIVKWNGISPEKCSKLVNSLQKAVSNERINKSTLKAHVQSLLLKWLNTTKALNAAGGIGCIQNNKALLRTLGVGDEDIPLLKHWMNSIQNINS